MNRSKLPFAGLIVLVLFLGMSTAQEFDASLGADTYNSCMGCHQADGKGRPGIFPPLAENMPIIFAADGGREYLINVLLFGLQGEIEVLGATYNGLMPSWAASLSDDQIAAVLNHELTSWGNEQLLTDPFEPITSDEVAVIRELGRSASDVLELRQGLVLE
ncbi:MAG: cytochrome c [Trueperaceae bacterium]|nr:MAG: cytochrome c [Trueperaceae bacterium]